MSYNVAVLPDDVLHTLVDKVNENNEEGLQESLRFLRLPHPRTGVPSLFLPTHSSDRSRSKILEVQAVSPPNPRSWFMPEGEIVDDGKLLLLTPIDSAFILIPILQCISPASPTLGVYRSIEDIFEEAASKLIQSHSSSDAQEGLSLYSRDDILQLTSLACVQSAMKRICDTKAITPEIVVYRHSPQKMLEYLNAKVARLAKPAVHEASLTLIRQLAKDGFMEDGMEALLESARIRAACDLISQYMEPQLYSALLSTYDFTAVNAHLQAIQDQQAALAVEEARETKAKKGKTKDPDRADKKRKARTKASNGVEKLKKANVNGMAKISTFFQKPAK